MAVITMTGGAGHIATCIRPLLAKAGHQVQLLDVQEPVGPLAVSESFRHVDGTHLNVSVDAFRGSDLVIHLAAHPSERTFDQIVALNVGGAYVAHEAARLAGVPKILAASSVHAVGYLLARDAAREVVPLPRPDTFYGASKAFLESLGSLYADRYGHVVVTARIMTAVPEPVSIRDLSTWFSPADTVRLIEAILAYDIPGHNIVWGVSRNTRGWVSLEAGERIGFLPEDDAEVFAGRIEGAGKPGQVPGDFVLGDSFTNWALGEPPP